MQERQEDIQEIFYLSSLLFLRELRVFALKK